MPITFNLTAEKWIPVLDKNLNKSIVSSLDLFKNWNKYREISADNSLDIYAIYRHLITLVHAAYQHENCQQIDKDDGNKIIRYLEIKSSKFDLLDPDKPFYQDPTIAKKDAGSVYQAWSIYGKNTSTVFCKAHDWSNFSISLPQAARLLFRLQLFDLAGRKAGSNQAAGVIPTVGVANILPIGSTLKQTLLLNYDRLGSNPNDLPIWDNPEPSENITGYLGYLTYPWRRCRLFLDGDRVTKIASHAGFRLDREEVLRYERHIAYRITPKGTFPVNLNLDREIWRDASAILQSSATAIRPRVIDDLTAAGHSMPIAIKVFGFIVDNAKPLSTVESDLVLPPVYLKNPNLCQLLGTAIAIAEAHQEVFRSFRGSPYHVLAETLNHGEPKKLADSLDGEREYWGSLSLQFPLLLEELATGVTDLERWLAKIQLVTRQSFTASIGSISDRTARAKSLNSLELKLLKLRKEYGQNPV